jgi:Type ISP C-terminal specificity domain
VRYTYRPFDVRWLYWEPETKLLDEKRSEYWPHVIEGNIFVEARERQPKEDFNRGTIVRGLPTISEMASPTSFHSICMSILAAMMLA